MQSAGAPSPTQQYVVSGINTPSGITITQPAGFEISKDTGASWTNANNGIRKKTNIIVPEFYIYPFKFIN